MYDTIVLLTIENILSGDIMSINKKEFNLEQVVKLCVVVNISLFLFVAFMLTLFVYFNITPMIYYSVIAMIGYVLYFMLLKRQKVCAYMWCVYATIIIYMAIATICLGYKCGFNLYSMSLIPIIFYSQYISTKIDTKDPNPLAVSIAIVAVSIISSAIAIINGPLYEINKTIISVMLACNAISVSAFLIYYTKMIIDLVIESEKKLNSIANIDLLTDLYSRRYMINYLEEYDADDEGWLAMADVDDFKKINDTYGHNCGDYVLNFIAQKMKNICSNCVISRWGGEEFLIHNGTHDSTHEVLEKLRREIENSECIYKQQKINISLTIGVAQRNADGDIEEWIKRADDRLYYGKNNGKNMVVD